jgi:hypothetical protein
LCGVWNENAGFDRETTCIDPILSLHLALHARAGFRHSDLAFIVGMWDRLADEIKARLIEVIRENLPSETLL